MQMKTAKKIDTSSKLRSFFKGELLINEPLSKYTSIDIGGSAAIFIKPKDDLDLAQAIKFFGALKMPFRIIGNGTNLLIDDAIFDFAVIKLGSIFFEKISVNNDILFASAGVNLQQILNFSIKNGIGGLEFLAGIPGTVGGALVMNAGIRNPDLNNKVEAAYLSISDSLIKISVMDKEGKIFNLNKNEVSFAYRWSGLKEFIVLGAYFRVSNRSKEQIKKTIKALLERRKAAQELCVRSAGCIFKNPISENISAGELIDNAGFKGKCIGQAQVSQVHANFIINKGNATFVQVDELIGLIRDKVKQNSGIELELEAEIWNSKES